MEAQSCTRSPDHNPMLSKKQGTYLKSEAASQRLIHSPPPPPRKFKLALLLEQISRDDGATLKELTSVTGWLPHTARAAITGLRKLGHDIRCKRVDGLSRYTVDCGQ